MDTKLNPVCNLCLSLSHLHEVFEDALLLGRVGHTHAHDAVHGAAAIQRPSGHLAEGSGCREPPDAQGVHREHTFRFA